MSTELLKFNLNDYVYVRLTEKARHHLRADHAAFWTQASLDGRVAPDFRPPDYREPEVDADGFTAFQAHDFIDKFGPVMSYGLDFGEYFQDGIHIFLRPASLKPGSED